MYYICTKSEIGCTLDEKQMEMQTLNKKADATREKDIYRVTVVGSVVNFLLLVFKFFAGARYAGAGGCIGIHRFQGSALSIYRFQG